MKLCTSLFIALVVTAFSISTANAQLYWDINGSTAGSTNTPPDASGLWDDVTTNWNPTADGTGTTQLWDDASVAVFAAGSDATGPYTVTVVGTQTVGGITIEESSFAIVTITGGALSFTGATPTVTVPLDEVSRIDSNIVGSSGFTSAGDGTLVLGGTNTHDGTLTVDATNVLALGSAGALSPNAVLNLATSVAGPAAVQMSTVLYGSHDATVKSISAAGTTTAPTIAMGTQRLTIEDDGETQSFRGLLTSAGTANDFVSPHGIVEKNGDGTLNFTANMGGFVGGEIILNDGVLGFGENNSFGSNANGSKLTINGGTLRKIGTGGTGANLSVRNVDINASFKLDTNGVNVQLTGTAANVITTLGTANPTIEVMNAATNSVFIIPGIIKEPDGVGVNDKRGFTKTGPGTLNLLNSQNSYRGETTIQEGNLRLVFGPLNAPPAMGRIGDGLGRVNLSGGALQYNGSNSSTDQVGNPQPHVATVTNPIRVTADSEITYFSTGNVVTFLDIDFIFTSSDISGTGGTLTFRNVGTCGVGPSCTYRPTFTGSGFDFSRPVVISHHATVPATRTTFLNVANTSGTQTWSGSISGTGGIRRTAAGSGVTVLTGANTYMGGTFVDGGTLRASGSAATFGDGNITVSAGLLEIASGVLDAIDNAASLTVTTGGMVSLGAGVNDILTGLTLDSFVAGPGTYGAPGSGATNPGLINPSVYFTGTGILTIAAQGLPGDYNQDDVVDAADYVMWRKLFPDPSGPALPNDDSPGVNTDDYDRWVEQFGESNAGSGGNDSTGQVPEPASTVLILAALFAVGAIRTRQL